MNKHPSRRRALLRIGGMTLAGCALAFDGWAVTYLQPKDAMKRLIPQADRFARLEIVSTGSDLETIERASGTRLPRGFAPEAWVALAGDQPAGWVCFDRVIGKYDFIDYAVGFDASGAVTGVEILVYRESYGGEVRNARWRAQFVGRAAPHAMRFDTDIRNISGATLSSRHVTEGVQRLSAFVTTTLLRSDAGRR